MLQVNSMGYLEPGTVLTGNYKYQIISEIGRGAMAVVYLAKQIDLERPVAIKVLSAELAANTSFVLRFFNEVRTAAALSHPNIIQAYDAGIANEDIYYFAMEYVKGETLLQRLLREGRLEVVTALKYATEIARALNYGWQSQRLTHGDIKPENIMVNDMDQAKLADFGLAKVAGHEYEGHELMLTPHYAAPELIKGLRPKGDCRTDIYAFGASLHHLLSGRPPFPGNDGQEVMKRHLQEPVEALYLRCPGVRPDLSDFIVSMLEKNPEDRPADWTAVLDSLERCSKTHAKTLKQDAGRVRFQRPSGNVRISPVQGAGLAQKGAVNLHARRKSKEAFWWYAVFALSILILLVLSYIYCKKMLHRRFDAKMEQVVQENQPGGNVDVPSTKIVEKDAREVTQTPVPATTSDAGSSVEEKSPTPFPDVAADKAEDPIPKEHAADIKEQAALTEQGKAESSAQKIVPKKTVYSAAVQPSYPEYSLWGTLTVPQRKAAEEIQAWFLLASFQHVPGQPGSAEKMMRALELWLQGNTGKNSFSELMEFVQREVVPLLDEGLPRLLLNKGALLGKTFSGRNNLKLTVLDVLPEGLKIELILEKGTMRRDMTWREVIEGQLLPEFYRVAFFEDKVNGKPELYLAQLLFSRNSKAFQAAVRNFSAAGGTHSSRWEELGGKVNLPEKDFDNLKELADLAQICRRGGSRYEAGRIARRLLLRGNSLVASEYRNFLEAVLSLCEEFHPDIQGGRLVREAQELLPDQPDQALACLMKAQFLGGKGKFPEKVQIASLQEKAMGLLVSHPQYETKQDSEEAWPFFPRSSIAPWPFQGIAWAARLKQEANVPESVQQTTMTLAHLEAGNWYEVFGKESQLDAESFPASASEEAPASLLYGKSLLQLRNGNGQRAWEGDLQRLYQLSVNDYLAPDAKALIYEYAVLSRQLLEENAGQMLLSIPDEFWLGGNSENLARRVRIVLIAFLENGQYQRAMGLTLLLISRLQEQSVQSGLLRELQWLQKTVQNALREASLQKNVPADTVQARFFQGIGGNLNEYQFRLRLSAMGTTALNGAKDRQLLTFFAEHAKAWYQIGGDAIFDWLLRRVAWQISAGDINLALQLCNQLVALQLPCLFAYYPRVYILRGALLCLNGQSDALIDNGYLLRNCGASNEMEKRLIGVTNNQVQLYRPGNETTSYYWKDLLWFCLQTGLSRTNGSSAREKWEASNEFAAEMVLCRALTGVPATEPKPKTTAKEP